MGLRLLAGPAAQSVDLTPMTRELEALTTMVRGVDAKADHAEATGQNARQMVLNRDARLNQAATQAETAASEYATLAALTAEYVAARDASIADRAALHSQVDALTASLAGKVTDVSVGSLGIAAILLGSKATLTVPLVTPMATATYRVRISHSAAVDLTKSTITNVQRTTTAVTFTLTATGLAMAAGTVVVLAVG